MALLVHDAQVVLCPGVALAGGEPEQAEGLAVVPPHAVALLVHDAQVALRIGVALDCRLLEPGTGLVVVPPHAAALRVHDAQVELCPGVALIGRYPKQTVCLVVVSPLICAMPLSGDIHDLVSTCIHGGPPRLHLRQKFALRTPLYINVARSLPRC